MKTLTIILAAIITAGCTHKTMEMTRDAFESAGKKPELGISISIPENQSE